MAASLVFFYLAILNILLQGIYLVFPFITKLQLDQLTNQNTELFGLLAATPFRLFIFIVLIYLVMQLVGTVVDQFLQYVNDQLAFVLEKELLSEVTTYLQRFDASLLTGKRNGLIVNNLRSLNSTMYQMWRMGRDIAVNLVQFLILLPLITKIDPQLFFVLIISNVLLLLLNLYDERVIRQLEPVNDKIQNSLWATEWVLMGPDLFNLFMVGGEGKIMMQHQRLLTKKRRHDRSVLLGANMRSIIRSSIDFLSVSLVAILVGRSVFFGTMTIGTFTMVTMYASQLGGALSRVFDTIRSSVEARLNWRKFKYLFTLPTGYQDPIGAVKKKLLRKSTVTLRTSKLSFIYPNMARHERQYLRYLLKDTEVAAKRLLVPKYTSDELHKLVYELTTDIKKMPTVLSNVSVEFNPGTITTVVGENGAGKSTLVKLLLRAYDPTSGSILINDEPFVNYQPKVLRQKISFLSQNPFLIDGLSVRENLTLGCYKKVTTEEINRTLAEIGLEKIIDNLPQRLSSKIASDTDLSGGQRQLIAFTRLILQDRPVIIMDEGSSQLDALRELEIMKILKNLAEKKNKTIILITHRLTTARKSDTIYVLDGGKIVEHGPHLELLASPNGKYSSLWQAQVGN